MPVACSGFAPATWSQVQSPFNSTAAKLPIRPWKNNSVLSLGQELFRYGAAIYSNAHAWPLVGACRLFLNQGLHGLDALDFFIFNFLASLERGSDFLFFHIHFRSLIHA